MSSEEKHSSLDLDAVVDTLRDIRKLSDASIVDKNIVLLIGDTGAGKSTTLNFLAGQEMQIRQNDNEDMVVEAKNLLPGFEIGHRLSSTTKRINTFVREKDELTLCDTPGFKDTTGEHDF